MKAKAQARNRTRVPPLPAPDESMSWRAWACVLALLGVTVLAFSPTFRADFIRFDDQYYVQENERLRSLEGLRKIWNPRATERGTQYYPLVVSSFWLEYRLWGRDARGYHATNVVLHIVNTGLVLLLARAFGLSRAVAFGTAALFALHPTQVESVAWITERKNVLSTLFYLLAFLAYLGHRRTGSRAAYAGFLAAFVAALLSKTQTVTLPVTLALADAALQQTGRLRRAGPMQVAIRLVPLLAIGAVAAVITVQAEGRHITPVALTVTERVLVAANAAAFYVRLFLAPIGLAPIYPRWNLSAGNPLWWIAVAVWPVIAAALFRWRQRVGPLPLWGMAHFFLSLGPALGLVSFNFMIFSFVADHFLYVPIIGAALTVALLAERVATVWPTRRMVVGAMAALALIGCAALTYREATHWRNNESFWLHARSRNPNGFGPNWNLGLHYRRTKLSEQALPFFARATEIWPDTDFAFRRYVQTLATVRGPEAAIQACTAKLRSQPRFYAAHLERAINHERLKNFDAALKDYGRVKNLVRKDSSPWREADRGTERVRKRVGGSPPPG